MTTSDNSELLSFKFLEAFNNQHRRSSSTSFYCAFVACKVAINSAILHLLCVSVQDIELERRATTGMKVQSSLRDNLLHHLERSLRLAGHCWKR